MQEPSRDGTLTEQHTAPEQIDSPNRNTGPEDQEHCMSLRSTSRAEGQSSGLGAISHRTTFATCHSRLNSDERLGLGSGYWGGVACEPSGERRPTDSNEAIYGGVCQQLISSRYSVVAQFTLCGICLPTCCGCS